jgi:hypothetical protein
MPRYSQFRYGEARYGRYEIILGGNTPLQSIRQYRLRTIDSEKNESRPITHISADIIGVSGPAKVRVRTNGGKWVYSQSADIAGSSLKIRARIVSNGEGGPWIECALGTIKP